MSANFEEPHPLEQSVALGAGVYTKRILSIYDLLVIRFENPIVWRCPSPRILAFYNQHVAGRHLDVGVGTGYYLDRCQFPIAAPTIGLLDLNPNSLRATAQRIRRYNPATYQVNVLEPISAEVPHFDSIGLNFLLHCLPGNLTQKGIVFKHLKPLLKPGGVIFGSTILGQGVKFNLLGKLFMRVYNSYLIPGSRVLYNEHDNVTNLTCSLEENFERCSVQVMGTAAFFVAYQPV
jgi:SAM-dependent methyltransferase